MAIRTTDLHRLKLISQAEIGTLNLHEDVLRNANKHREWAQRKEVDLEVLQQYVTGCMDLYQKRINKVMTFITNCVEGDPEYASVAESSQMAISSIKSIIADVEPDIKTVMDMPHDTYEDIIVLCDYLIANIDPVPTLWD